MLSDAQRPVPGTVGPVRRLILILSLGAASAAAAAAVVFSPWSVYGGGTSAAEEPDWSQRFVDCAGGVMTHAVLESESVQGCILDVMLQAAEEGQVWDMQAALERQIEATPAIYDVCHNMGHLVGRRAFELDPDIARLVGDNPSATCAYAIGHGVFDGFAESDPTPEGFRAAANACASKQGVEAGLCADGIGHAAWSSSHDLATAVSYCTMLPPGDMRAACSEGIIMQIFEPAGFASSTYDLERAFSELPLLCERWPSSDADSVAGCHMGAGYMYTRVSWQLESRVRCCEVDVAELQGLIVQDIGEAAGMCRRHHTGTGVSECLHSVAIQIPHSIYNDLALLEASCHHLGPAESFCLGFEHNVS